MNMNIYNAFIVNSDKQLSVKDCVDLANNSKAKVMKQFIPEFSQKVLTRLFYTIDLVKFYGDNVINMDKISKGYVSELLKYYLDIKNRYKNKSEKELAQNLWFLAEKNFKDSLDYLEQKFKVNYYYKTKLVFVPYKNKMLVMYFGDPAYSHIISDDTEHYLDYHYQNQTNQPDDISDEKWKQREKDWNEVLGPDYIPENHGLTFTLLDYNDYTTFIQIDHNFENAYARRREIAKYRIENIFETTQYPSKNEPIATIKITDDTANIPELANKYRQWKDETITHIKTVLDIN